MDNWKIENSECLNPSVKSKTSVGLMRTAFTACVRLTLACSD